MLNSKTARLLSFPTFLFKVFSYHLRKDAIKQIWYCNNLNRKKNCETSRSFNKKWFLAIIFSHYEFGVITNKFFPTPYALFYLMTAKIELKKGNALKKQSSLKQVWPVLTEDVEFCSLTLFTGIVKCKTGEISMLSPGYFTDDKICQGLQEFRVRS